MNSLTTMLQSDMLTTTQQQLHPLQKAQDKQMKINQSERKMQENTLLISTSNTDFIIIITPNLFNILLITNRIRSNINPIYVVILHY